MAALKSGECIIKAGDILQSNRNSTCRTVIRDRMRELSNKRAIAAMPVAGSYRSIDFALSNMSNSHVQKSSCAYSV